MSHGTVPDPAVTPPEPAEESTAEPSTPTKPLASLWNLMGAKPAEIHPDVATKDTTVTPLRDQDTSKFDNIVEDALQSENEKAPALNPSTETAAAAKPKRWRPPANGNDLFGIEIRKPQSTTSDVRISRKAKTSLWLGGLAIGLSAFAVYPGMWTKLPALSAGFIALFSGFLAADEIRTSRGRLLGMNQALLGMALSITGMFLGPLLAWAIGDLAAFQSHQQVTETRLETIGTAIDRFYDRQRQFPAGGTFLEQPGAKDRPMHGWMTALLPYMGYEQLHKKINPSLPFDDAVNATALRTQVPEFLVAGVEQTTSINQYAAAHFAGVGGQEKDANGDTVHFGVFDKNSTVFRQDVSDGLSNTLMAGQIPGNYPAWGEPSNWRRISQGLNRDQRGFGSPGGGDVLFLMADGSVRSLAADTDPRVLHSMSTRDGTD
ncbi:hypothetical protein CA54_36220 [Symmachiella macrocystis]|uniref:DUF1559 domain-containing protein n=1 Tax=Symmachiella macrocystis TaxID=2527985 RepID=A0A5C6BR95_9PLAN|nr:DUF1559 domain-containing protein [Symmachiella macrocystis]TWU14753.1 hypothetical protein CA54_36220 [Symmachiella macrocystis]